MNKKLFAGLLATTALASVLVTTTAEAETLNTRSGISFFDTNQPGGGGGMFEDNLVFAWAPIEFDFGNHEVTGQEKNKTYKQVIGSDKRQYLAVSDDRPAEDKKDGWKLTATLDEFTDTTSTTNKLADAKLSFEVGTLQKYKIDIAASDAAGHAVPNVADTNALEALPTAHSSLYTKNPTTPITLTAGDPTPVNVFSYASSQAITDTLGVAGEVSNVKLKVSDHSNVANKRFVSNVKFELGLNP